jgi:hypothetical protein
MELMQQQLRQNWRRLVSAALPVILLTSLVVLVPANAATLIFQKQGNDNYEPLADLRYDHETQNMAIQIYDDNKDLIIVRLTFASNVSNTTFASSSTLLRLKFMPYLSGTFRGNTGNIWIEAPRTPYQGSTKIPAVASSYVSEKSLPTDPRKDMSACGALTWMDDVSSRNMVSFQFSRNCFDLPNTFWAISQVETDIFNSTLSKDLRYTPVEPFYVDAQSVPKPPKVIPKNDQSISASTSSREYTMNNTTIQINSSSSTGSPLLFTSRTPTTCAVSSTGLIQTLASGNCQVAVDAAATLTLNAAPTVLVSVNLVKKTQALYFNPPGIVYLNQGSINLAISSEFGLPVTVVSTSPSICTFPYPTTNPTTAQMIRSGTCSFKVTQPGNNIYNSNEGFANFYIEPNPSPTPTIKPTVKPTVKPSPTPTVKPTVKPSPTRTIITGGGSSGGDNGGTEVEQGGVAGGTKITITCVKIGKKDIPVISPKKCPSGYTKKK